MFLIYVIMSLAVMM